MPVEEVGPAQAGAAGLRVGIGRWVPAGAMLLLPAETHLTQNRGFLAMLDGSRYWMDPGTLL